MNTTPPVPAAQPMDVQQPSFGGQGEEVNTLFLSIGLLIERRWMILASTLAGLLVGFVYLNLATPIYSAQALIQVEIQKSGGLAELEAVTDALEGNTPIAAEIEIIRSRYVIGRVIDTLRLDTVDEPRYFPVIGRYLVRRNEGDRLVSPPFEFLGKYAWGGERFSTAAPELPPSLLGVSLTVQAGENGAYRLLGPQGVLLGSGKAGEQLDVPYGSSHIKLFFN